MIAALATLLTSMSLLHKYQDCAEDSATDGVRSFLLTIAASSHLPICSFALSSTLNMKHTVSSRPLSGGAPRELSESTQQLYSHLRSSPWSSSRVACHSPSPPPQFLAPSSSRSSPNWWPTDSRPLCNGGANEETRRLRRELKVWVETQTFLLSVALGRSELHACVLRGGGHKGCKKAKMKSHRVHPRFRITCSVTPPDFLPTREIVTYKAGELYPLIDQPLYPTIHVIKIKHFIYTSTD